MTMLTDGLKAQSLEEEIRQLDVAELLEESCALDQPVGVRAAMPQDPPERLLRQLKSATRKTPTTPVYRPSSNLRSVKS